MASRTSSRSSETATEKKALPLKHSFKVCFCFRRLFKLKVVEAPEEVRHQFEKYSKNGTMSVEDLKRFLVEMQGEKEATIENAQAIFDSVRHLGIFHRRGLHIDAFFRHYLFNTDLNPPIISRLRSVSNLYILFISLLFIHPIQS